MKRKPYQTEFDYYESKVARHAATTSWLAIAFILCLVVAVLFASGAAHADAEVTLNWTQPTECTSGKPVTDETCGPLLRSQLRCGATAGGPYEWLWGVDATNTSDTRSYPDGEYHCILRTSNAVGFSADSNEIHFTVTTPAPTPALPKPPIVVTIEVNPSP
jgi:hypothetical protein